MVACDPRLIYIYIYFCTNACSVKTHYKPTRAFYQKTLKAARLRPGHVLFTISHDHSCTSVVKSITILRPYNNIEKGSCSEKMHNVQNVPRVSYRLCVVFIGFFFIRDNIEKQKYFY